MNRQVHPSTKIDYKSISSYGIIGDSHSAALVGMDGSVDWCCLPRFDSPSIFAAMLDSQKGGKFAITPVDRYASTQRYSDNSNVLETSFQTQAGACTLVDCMPLYRTGDGMVTAPHQIIRIARCTEGNVTLQLTYAPRPDYARTSARLAFEGADLVCSSQAGKVSLQSPVALELQNDIAAGVFSLGVGQEAVFVLSHEGPPGKADDGLDPYQRLEETLRYWRREASGANYTGPWQRAVMRSYLVLHLLTYLPTGGIVAAPTTSLPEQLGGARNWDYRYVWLRDAAFTVEALMSLGHAEEAKDFFSWLCQVCADCAQRDALQIMFGVGGEIELHEEELEHLEGYRGSKPVRIGNKASVQQQHDIYGEVLASAQLLFGNGSVPSDADWELLRMLANLAAAHWQEPDMGIWEMRGKPRHFVYSKVMCWVALDCAIALAEQTGRAGPESASWKRTAEAIKAEVLQRGWNPQKEAFVQHYDTEAMDASNLLLPLVGFISVDDPRMASTVECIRRELGHGPFLQRYRTEETDDGLAGSEGAFTLCSFWLVRVLARMGRLDEARAMFEELLTYASPLGLYSEMVEPHNGEALGNFPQDFTHIGLILAARECDIEAGPPAQR